MEEAGPRDEDQDRLGFVDRAVHGDPPPNPYIVSYTPVLQQALRDLSAWVERGVPAPASTRYRLADDAQIAVPGAAAERQGIQPVVALTADGGVRAEARVGQPVEFEAVVEVPPNTGKIVSAEWDFDGLGDFPVKSELVPGERVVIRMTHAFARAGTYFPTLRAASQRQGDPSTPFARIANLGRVRVVVA